MSAFTQRKTQVESRLARRTSDQRSLLTEIGKLFLESGSVPQEEPFTEPLADEQRTSARVQELTEVRERITSIQSRLDEIRSRRDETVKRQKQIDADLEPHYRTIGEHAFRVFRDNPLIDQEYAEIFTPVLDVNEEMKQISRDIEKADAEMSEKAFLEKMVIRGRLIVLKNRLAIKEGQLRRLATDAGKQIAATDFITTIGDPALDEAAGPFLELLEESRRLASEQGVLDDEREALGNELSSLGVEKRVEARLSQLEKELADARVNHDESYVALAQALRDSNADAGSLSARLDELSALDEAIESDRAIVHRLDAAIGAERLQSEIDQIDSQIARKTQQISSIQADIKELTSRKEKLDGEQATLREQRGAVEDLMDSRE